MLVEVDTGEGMYRLHTDREYEGELIALRDQMLLMSATVEKMLAGAIHAFQAKSEDQARAALQLDNQIDQLELDIDNACLRILARRQPVASDLRFITAALKAVTDLERIGDLASNICERVIELGPTDPPAGAAQIQEMADIARAMLRDGLDAFVARDAVRAEGIRERDNRVDQVYADMFPLMIQHMSARPEQCDAVMRILSIGKYLERIADHATNLAEMVIFMVEGEDVRHLGKKQAANS
jgi:phosphate transport system protein